jgi:transketolase
MKSAKGGYRLVEGCRAARKVVLIATGSEVEIALDVAAALEAARASALMSSRCRAGTVRGPAGRPTAPILPALMR